MDLRPMFARLLEASLPGERYIDGIDESSYLLDGRRTPTASTSCYQLSGGNPGLGGCLGPPAPTAGYPMIFNLTDY